MADQAPNPRSAMAVSSAPRIGSRVVTRGNGENTGVVNRTGVEDARSGRESVVARSGHKNMVARSAKASVTTNRSADTVARSASKTQVSRSAILGAKNKVRSATNTPVKSGMARAANLARATAVFNDVSKIGGGYAQCREAYATCMDQFCANANDTYRRCYCSQRFSEFRDTEAALDAVKLLLQQFEDNNLNAVDKTAAEVNAMYTATVGEAAIKNDVSGAQSILTEVTDILSGKKKPGEDNEKNTLNSELGLLDIDEDIWGGSSSIFDNEIQRTNITDLEGQALYNETNKQCMELVKDVCSSEAVLNMATSSYNIMIVQDCNVYERKIDTQREAVMDTVRQAEKILRQARLEEYREHNSADVNECLTKVRTAMMQDTACGENYKRCLDYTGNYIDQNGNAIYSAALFKLTNLIDLYGGDGMSSDILGMNPNYNRWFDDEKRMFVTTALDSCRDIADTVWREFKRTAIIEIAQAQEAKLEEVRSSCVTTITECYDNQSGQMKDMEKNTAEVAGAIGVQAARAMCAEKVMACAAVYGNGTTCKYDPQTRKIENSDACGLTQLMDYVGLVDSVKIAEECTSALTKRAQEMCAPASDDTDHAYPWGCRAKPRSDLLETLTTEAGVYCADLSGDDKHLNDGLVSGEATAAKLVDTIANEITVMLDNECSTMGGIWMSAYETSCETDDDTGIETCKYGVENAALSYTEKPLQDFYTMLNGRSWDTKKDGDKEVGHSSMEYGKCFENSVQLQCQWQDDATGGNGYAKYENGKCVFTTEWYEYQCKQINGYYVDSQCYIAP